MRASRYPRALGFLRGLFTLEKILYSRATGRLTVSLPAPRWRKPIELRPHTSDLSAFEQVFLDGQYDIRIHRQPRLIIDGGAHIGCTSAFLATRYPDALIVAIEPEERNFELLRRNVRYYPNVMPVRAALWKSTAPLAIANPEATTWAFRVRNVETEDCATTLGITIDDILGWTGARYIDILKVDIEGSEKELFSSPGCQRWVGSVRWIVAELHDHYVPGCSETFFRATDALRLSQETSGECVVLRCAADALP